MTVLLKMPLKMVTMRTILTARLFSKRLLPDQRERAVQLPFFLPEFSPNLMFVTNFYDPFK